MRVAIIEDDPGIAEAIAAGLRLEGHVAEVAADGVTGLHLAADGSFDAIVLDILLPKKNGFVVCAELREIGCETPILMLTSKSGEYDIAEALDSGADDYLVKPFSMVVLHARLRALVRRTGGGRRATIDADRLSIDPATRRCLLDGVDLPLTTREFAIVEHLARQRGAVTSRQQVLDAVWDRAFNGDPNIVEVYISRIRSKLGRAGGSNLVETVRGVGYRLNSDAVE